MSVWWSYIMSFMAGAAAQRALLAPLWSLLSRSLSLEDVTKELCVCELLPLVHASSALLNT